MREYVLYNTEVQAHEWDQGICPDTAQAKQTFWTVYRSRDHSCPWEEVDGESVRLEKEIEPDIQGNSSHILVGCHTHRIHVTQI